ncbi:hypothetical protein MEME101129_26985 [Methylobacterium mesophilicum]
MSLSTAGSTERRSVGTARLEAVKLGGGGAVRTGSSRSGAVSGTRSEAGLARGSASGGAVRLRIRRGENVSRSGGAGAAGSAARVCRTDGGETSCPGSSPPSRPTSSGKVTGGAAAERGTGGGTTTGISKPGSNSGSERRPAISASARGGSARRPPWAIGSGNGSPRGSAPPSARSVASGRGRCARWMLRSTTTSLGPPTSSRCSTLSRRSRISCRARSSSYTSTMPSRGCRPRAGVRPGSARLRPVRRRTVNTIAANAVKMTAKITTYWTMGEPSEPNTDCSHCKITHSHVSAAAGPRPARASLIPRRPPPKANDVKTSLTGS